uniref:Uncharacterized protein n=1 Tax=Cucumis melo TaxID=3656 RepID=A0A9I9E621_CUCME
MKDKVAGEKFPDAFPIFTRRTATAIKPSQHRKVEEQEGNKQRANNGNAGADEEYRHSARKQN